jgi:hypothetical protein
MTPDNVVYLADHSVVLALPALIPAFVIVGVVLYIVAKDRRAVREENADRAGTGDENADPAGTGIDSDKRGTGNSGAERARVDEEENT